MEGYHLGAMDGIQNRHDQGKIWVINIDQNSISYFALWVQSCIGENVRLLAMN
jgi:hypothetical protein